MIGTGAQKSCVRVFLLCRPLLNHFVESHLGNHHHVGRAVVERHEIGRHQLEVGLVLGLVVVEPAPRHVNRAHCPLERLLAVLGRPNLQGRVTGRRREILCRKLCRGISKVFTVSHAHQH